MCKVAGDNGRKGLTSFLIYQNPLYQIPIMGSMRSPGYSPKMKVGWCARLRIHDAVARPLLARGQVSQLVGPVVVRVRCVALGPDPGGFVSGHCLVQLSPEVDVEHRLLIASFPLIAFPGVDPLRDAVLDIFGIGHDFDFARLFDGAQTLDGGRQLHAVVGGQRFAAEYLASAGFVAQEGSPAAGARVAQTGAVSDELDLLHGSVVTLEASLWRLHFGMVTWGKSAARIPVPGRPS